MEYYERPSEAPSPEAVAHAIANLCAREQYMNEHDPTAHIREEILIEMARRLTDTMLDDYIQTYSTFVNEYLDEHREVVVNWTESKDRESTLNDIELYAREKAEEARQEEETRRNAQTGTSTLH